MRAWVYFIVVRLNSIFSIKRDTLFIKSKILSVIIYIYKFNNICWFVIMKKPNLRWTFILFQQQKRFANRRNFVWRKLIAGTTYDSMTLFARYWGKQFTLIWRTRKSHTTEILKWNWYNFLFILSVYIHFFQKKFGK